MTRRSLSARRTVGLLLLCSMLCSIVPVPMPVNLDDAGKDTSTPFPCQNRPCGCQSASGCWTSCCCFTPAERIAWADRNHVRIPTDALKSLLAEASRPIADQSMPACTLPQHEDIVTSERSPADGEMTSLATAADSASSGCSHRDFTVTHDEDCDSSNSCCHHEDETAATAESSAPSENVEEPKRKYVLGFYADRCRGSGPHWNALPWCVLPAFEVRPDPLPPSLATPLVAASLLDDAFRQPPVPPPRLLAPCWG